ncbi:pirin family protein [Sabulicella glaciei]|uniref:Pirin family protein n=1 Tax=Sabulicella glaciei TaxID=2984948 RepID=A0ABT3NXG9_9PROT|nr:pirin family protein [Roseococcus sp. MDT2-1-1]MCW8086865.1 pirin family protein [Roseococcus sp. MDT2-1-1]
MTPGPETVILPRAHDVGGFEVRRALPSRERQMVGPFIFLDQMGPGEFLSGKGLDVRPHPHIGLSTLTYLYEGEILHRDTLGVRQPIRPGEVNWMTAGRGIAHSERTDEAQRGQVNRLFGIQSWVALPKDAEETAPAFAHHGAEALPFVEDGGMTLRLVAGEGWGLRSPVAVSSPLFYADVVLAPSAAVPLPDGHEERAAYLVRGMVSVSGQEWEAGRLLVFRAGDRLSLHAGSEGARLLLLGGAAMDGPRFLFWNFVSSSRDRIEQAKRDWTEGRFGAVADDEKEFIPLPEGRVTIRAGSRDVGQGSPTT